MPKLSIWNSGRKANDYKFVDRTISEYFRASGTALYVHKYLGTYDEDGNPTNSVTKIQDMVFLENRDRQYAQDIVELRGTYSVQDSDFDLRQFGLFLSNDDIFIEVHLNDMLAEIGRKLMSGDVVELPHLRDDALLDETKGAVNKYYVITDSMRASDGYSQTWFPHIWRIKCTPITDSQEYVDVFKKQTNDAFGLPMSTNLQDLLSTVGTSMGINDAVIEEAKEHVSKRNFETRQFYVVPGDETSKQYPWIFAGDGEPPNGAVVSGNGSVFPDPATEGEYYVRTDYEPPVLFQRKGSKWIRLEINYRHQDWSMAHRLIETFVNNKNTVTHDDGTVRPEKQALSKAVTPKADF